MNCLVIGSGGREHAIGWALSKSSKTEKIYVIPGNAGVNRATRKFCGVHGDNSPNVKDFENTANWCKSNNIDLVVVGPEDPLVNGITNVLSAHGIKCFGPTQSAAEIEASKSYSKYLVDKYGIPTAKWKAFTDPISAKEYIRSHKSERHVVKADGLAAGKGVIVASSRQEAISAVDTIMCDQKFGKCGEKVVIEEFLEGYEVSCLCFTDGVHVKCMPPSQDHKRLLDGDMGPNTGGMGAYCPCPLVDREEYAVIQGVMQKTVDALRAEGRPFTGMLYGGFMMTRDGAKVLEYNCRFGDPETQAVLPLLQSDLYDVMVACCTGKLHQQDVIFDQNSHCLALVLVSGGYPERYQKNLPITGLENLPDDILVFHAGTTLSPDQKVLTSGGRVLALVSVKNTLRAAAEGSLKAAENVNFDAKFYRKDIGALSLNRSNCSKSNGLTYSDAGVSIANGNALVEEIKPFCKETNTAGCVGSLGLFGSVFDLKLTEFKDPLLVSGTDGVGTKLLISLACGIHSTIGQDLVAMCVNDVLCHGARSLYFLDYFASGKLDVTVTKEVIKGVASACKLAGCALVGGETAEMPDLYPDSKYDVAGFVVGAVERNEYLPKVNEITAGDAVIGIPSSGVHSNGFSLVRKIVQKSGLRYTDVCPFDSRHTLGEALLTPTYVYVSKVIPAIKSQKVKAISHITGGGLLENIPRILPNGLMVKLDADKWKMPSVFGWLAHTGGISDTEMSRTFNCGIGMTLVVDRDSADAVATLVGGHVIGNVTSASAEYDTVKIENLRRMLDLSWRPKEIISTTVTPRVKVAVLISGSGTNLQALIDSCKKSESRAEIVLVISNVSGVQGIERARVANIPVQIISHKGFKSRELFDDELTFAIESKGADLVCLAGFMRILSGKFVKRWDGRLVNIHPSLLPSFKGMNAHEQVLAAGVKITGCTVHFVVEEVDSGAILEQEAVPVLPGDTIDTVQTRVKTAEHVAYPRAIQNLADRILATK